MFGPNILFFSLKTSWVKYLSIISRYRFRYVGCQLNAKIFHCNRYKSIRLLQTLEIDDMNEKQDISERQHYKVQMSDTEIRDSKGRGFESRSRKKFFLTRNHR